SKRNQTFYSRAGSDALTDILSCRDTAKVSENIFNLFLFLVFYISIQHRKYIGYIAELHKTGNRISIIHVAVAPIDLFHGTSQAQP
ncbi:unnamed protein product, partial [Bubo scandiacus]